MAAGEILDLGDALLAGDAVRVAAGDAAGDAAGEVPGAAVTGEGLEADGAPVGGVIPSG